MLKTKKEFYLRQLNTRAEEILAILLDRMGSVYKADRYSTNYLLLLKYYAKQIARLEILNLLINEQTDLDRFDSDYYSQMYGYLFFLGENEFKDSWDSEELHTFVKAVIQAYLKGSTLQTMKKASSSFTKKEIKIVESYREIWEGKAPLVDKFVFVVEVYIETASEIGELESILSFITDNIRPAHLIPRFDFILAEDLTVTDYCDPVWVPGSVVGYLDVFYLSSQTSATGEKATVIGYEGEYLKVSYQNIEYIIVPRAEVNPPVFSEGDTIVFRGYPYFKGIHVFDESGFYINSKEGFAICDSLKIESTSLLWEEIVQCCDQFPHLRVEKHIVSQGKIAVHKPPVMRNHCMSFSPQGAMVLYRGRRIRVKSLDGFLGEVAPLRDDLEGKEVEVHYFTFQNPYFAITTNSHLTSHDTYLNHFHVEGYPGNYSAVLYGSLETERGQNFNRRIRIGCDVQEVPDKTYDNTEQTSPFLTLDVPETVLNSSLLYGIDGRTLLDRFTLENYSSMRTDVRVFWQEIEAYLQYGFLTLNKRIYDSEGHSVGIAQVPLYGDFEGFLGKLMEDADQYCLKPYNYYFDKEYPEYLASLEEDYISRDVSYVKEISFVKDSKGRVVGYNHFLVPNPASLEAEETPEIFLTLNNFIYDEGGEVIGLNSSILYGNPFTDGVDLATVGDHPFWDKYKIIHRFFTNTQFPLYNLTDKTAVCDSFPSVEYTEAEALFKEECTPYLILNKERYDEYSTPIGLNNSLLYKDEKGEGSDPDFLILGGDTKLNLSALWGPNRYYNWDTKEECYTDTSIFRDEVIFEILY